MVEPIHSGLSLRLGMDPRIFLDKFKDLMVLYFNGKQCPCQW